MAVSDAELRAPAGSKLLFRSEFKQGCAQYIRYTLPKGKRQKDLMELEEGISDDA